MTTVATVRASVAEDPHGIPEARVTAPGDVTLSRLEWEASQALAAYRLSLLKRPFSGGLELVTSGQTGPDLFVTVFKPRRIL